MTAATDDQPTSDAEEEPSDRLLGVSTCLGTTCNCERVSVGVATLPPLPGFSCSCKGVAYTIYTSSMPESAAAKAPVWHSCSRTLPGTCTCQVLGQLRSGMELRLRQA